MAMTKHNDEAGKLGYNEALKHLERVGKYVVQLHLNDQQVPDELKFIQKIFMDIRNQWRQGKVIQLTRLDNMIKAHFQQIRML